ncbi:MAG: hypothetical protein FKGGLIKP_00011 [Sodalis sp. Fse]|nr:MAG: hypothetical protein FKGGLIKP_00011 [Sodalis sp. Fse]
MPMGVIDGYLQQKSLIQMIKILTCIRRIMYCSLTKIVPR